MFHIVLLEPEIPPNTGNIIRLCANSGSKLHLIHPLGFVLSDRQVRRAGLDYHQLASVHEYKSLQHFHDQVRPERVFACSTRGCHRYADIRFKAGDSLLFGPETRGLPQALLQRVPSKQRISIPMITGNRSLNLSNAVAVILFEAWRQLEFQGSG